MQCKYQLPKEFGAAECGMAPLADAPHRRMACGQRVTWATPIKRIPQSAETSGAACSARTSRQQPPVHRALLRGRRLLARPRPLVL